jgi:hypothetical protein
MLQEFVNPAQIMAFSDESMKIITAKDSKTI